MLRGKTLNQSRVLQHKQLRSPHLELALKQEVFDEGNCARRYWQLYFPAIGWSSSRRDRKEDTAPNQMLNYGYPMHFRGSGSQHYLPPNWEITFNDGLLKASNT